MSAKYLRKPLSSTASWDGKDWLPTRNRTGPHSVRISTDWRATTTWRGVGTQGQASVETPGRAGVGTQGLAGLLDRAVYPEPIAWIPHAAIGSGERQRLPREGSHRRSSSVYATCCRGASKRLRCSVSNATVVTSLSLPRAHPRLPLRQTDATESSRRRGAGAFALMRHST